MCRYQSEIKNKALFLFLIIACLLFVLVHYCVLFGGLHSCSVKYANDYSITDMLNTQKIVSGLVVPTEEMVGKYDINQDGEITSIDTDIIKQFLLGYYDAYEVRNNNQKAIKYVND